MWKGSWLKKKKKKKKNINYPEWIYHNYVF